MSSQPDRWALVGNADHWMVRSETGAFVTYEDAQRMVEAERERITAAVLDVPRYAPLGATLVSRPEGGGSLVVVLDDVLAAVREETP